MSWIHFALLTALALAVADNLVKVAVGKLSNSVALLLYGCCTFLTGLVWVFWQWIVGVPQFANKLGILAALGVGLAFSGVAVGLYATFGAGAPVSVGSPVIRFGGVVLASLFGLAFLQEVLTLRYLIGMLLACSGLYLIVTR